MYRQVTAKPQVVEDVDLHGSTALLARSNCGVGLETSHQLLDLGVSKLILAVRDGEKGRAATTGLLADRKDIPPHETIAVWRLDLSAYDSMVSFAECVAKALTRLDITMGLRMITDAAVRHGEKTYGQFLSFQKLVP